MGTYALSEPRAETARDSRALLLLTGLAALARIAFLLLEPATEPVADERTWTGWAAIIASPRVSFSPLRMRMVFHPPLYPYFIAALYAPAKTLTAAKWAQALLGTLLVPAVGRAASLAFGRRAGLAAAAIAAFYPELVWFSVHFWAETLFMVFLWWGFERLLAADAHGGPGAAAVAGLLWGLAVLTRETVLYFTPVPALWLALGVRSGAGARGGGFLLAALLTVAPWTWRNQVVFQAFVPVSTAGGLNLYQGNALLSRQEVYDRYHAIEGRIESYRWAQREGLRAIWQRQPRWIFEKLRDEMPSFWGADSQAVVHIKRGAYGAVPAWAAASAAVVVLAPYLAVLALFVVGLAVLPRGRAGIVLLLFLIYYNGIHVVTHGYARYRLPALPVVFMVAGLAWAVWRERAFPAVDARRAAAVATVGLALLLSLLPSFRINIGEPAFGLVPPEDAASEKPSPP